MAAIPLEEIHYPESDGKPVAETEFHFEELVYTWQALKERYAAEPDVFVGANLFLYYRKGDPSGVVAPDGFVVKGVPKLLPGNQRRRKYLLWEEGQAPCFVLETTSEDTRHEDETTKKEVYRQLGVAEYFRFDPLGEYLNPPLQGLRLVRRRYRPIRPSPDGSLLSQSTGVIFRVEGSQLRLIHAATGTPLLRNEEVPKARQQAKERAAVEAQARRQAEEKAAAEVQARIQIEERIRALEAEIARLRQPAQD